MTPGRVLADHWACHPSGEVWGEAVEEEALAPVPLWTPLSVTFATVARHKATQFKELSPYIWKDIYKEKDKLMQQPDLKCSTLVLY